MAIFTSPYVILDGDAALAAAADPQVHGVPFQKRFAVERFPDLFPWNDPRNRYIHSISDLETWGVAYCLHCPCRQKRQLHWPDDAFYRVELSCGLLWARNRDHLLRLRQSISDPQKRGWMFSNLLSKSFFLKRNRDRVLRGIDELLSKAEIGRESGIHN